MAVATAASAQTTIITPTSQPPGTFFQVAGNINSGPVAATLGHTGIAAGNFTDIFQFRLDQNGTGSGSLTTGTETFLGSTDVDFISVLVNGLSATLTYRDASGAACTTRGVGTCGINETASISGVPILFGQLNTITVNGLSRGLGSYGGNATFTPAAAVPEPGTWAMMLIGFGGIGYSMRRRRKTSALLPQAA
jgi:hypothetical protein